MEQHKNYPLQSLNTFHIEAHADCYVRFDNETELAEFLHANPVAKYPFLVLGGGSNLLFVHDFCGSVLHPFLKGIVAAGKDRNTVRVRAMAGENWDELVAFTVAKGWGGLENLSLIPGSVGASAVQNIGAYGVEVKERIYSVEAVSMQTGEPRTFFADDCGFGYRTSHFKSAWAGQFIITAINFRLHRHPEFVLDYPGVQAAAEVLGKISLETIRKAIIDIRKGKLPDPDEIGNAGSFFKNPVVDPAVLDRLLHRFPDIPHYRHSNKRFKLAAGWMIEQCGFKGKRLGRAAVHDRQALVLVNRGGATGREILELSEMVRQAVHEKFGIFLDREVQVVPEYN